MPIDAGTASAGIGFGLDMAKFSFQQGIDQANNKKQRKWLEEQYRKQRADALADWNMQNAYNSPEAQMARLKAAGLNPNLVYGNGADATASQMPRQSDTGSYKPQSTPIDMNTNVMGAYFDAQVKQAQVDNMAAQKTLLDQQAIHEALKALNTVANTKSTEANTETTNALRQSSLDALRASINKMQTETVISSNQESRNQQLHSGNLELQNANLAKIAQDISTQKIQNSKTIEERTEVKARVNNLLREGILKDMEIQVRERGGNPNDAYWEKKAQQVIEYILNGGKEWKRYFDMLIRENPRN